MLKDKETEQRFPFFLPDGQHFLYDVRSSQTEVAGTYVGSVDSKEGKRILEGNLKTIYAAGHLLFIREGKLMAQPFDPARMETHGDSFLVADALRGVSAANDILAYGVLLCPWFKWRGSTGLVGLLAHWVHRTATSNYVFHLTASVCCSHIFSSL